MSSSTTAALSYHEPSIEIILILTTFLLLLNIVNYVLDKIIYCGLIGQIIIGIAWGLPGANWLLLDVQNTVMQVGYLGLILIVYEGKKSKSLTTNEFALLILLCVQADSRRIFAPFAPISRSPASWPRRASQHRSLSPLSLFLSSMLLLSKHSPPEQRSARRLSARPSLLYPRAG
jgi:hypothetical protein